MTTFRVWAPNAGRVDLVLAGGPATPQRPDDPIAMGPAGGGWWAVEVTDAGPGARYRFSVDGGPPRPDPRSPWQPEGVDGPSAALDHGAFAWSDAGWRGRPLAGAVIYELHTGTFSAEGTFEGVGLHLDHLVQLGVDAVELLPVAEFPGDRGWGYDGVLLYAPHHAYGGPEGLKALVDACHRRGLAVIIDVVYNHLGPSGNHLGEFGPYFTDRYSTPWGQAVNLDGPGSDEVRRFFLDNALMWLRDYHADGLRLDAVHAIVDTSATNLLEQLANEVEQLSAHLGRTLWLIAESDLNDPRVVRTREMGGHGMDAQWSDDFHHALHAALAGETSGYYADFGGLGPVAAALQRGFVYDGRHSPHRGRRHGRSTAGLPGSRFLGYLQNHDQIGNRAAGERSSALMSDGRLRAAAALILTAPFVPMLFMGEEWGASSPWQYFTDHRDPELGRAVSEGRRSEFGSFGWAPEDVPDPQDPGTFARSRLDWAEPAEPSHQELLDWHRRLIALRRDEPVLTDGRMDAVTVETDEAAGHLRVRRGPIVVAVNLGPSPWPDALPPRASVLLAHGLAGTGLAPDGVVVARQERWPASP